MELNKRIESQRKVYFIVWDGTIIDSDSQQILSFFFARFEDKNVWVYELRCSDLSDGVIHL